MRQFLAKLPGFHLRTYFPALRLGKRRRITQAVAYAIQRGDSFLTWLQNSQIDVRGKDLLEVGPGQEFGPSLMLMGHGARVILIDKYLAAWDPDFHPDFYLQLRRSLRKSHPGMDFTAIDAVIRSSSHDIPGLTTMACGLEEIPRTTLALADVCLSNAAFEHLYDCKTACDHLARLTRPGGIGFHQIDLRDHRDFSRPLEYLTLSDDEFAEVFATTRSVCGNRYRYTDFSRFFTDSGFQLVSITKNMVADDSYLDQAIPRMLTRYRELDRDVIKVLGALYIITRP